MTAPRRSGTWVHRWLVYAFTILFGCLLYWLLGFLVNDIGQWPGPDYAALEAQMLPAELRTREQQLAEQQGEVQRSIEALRARQGNLRDSTDTARTTMNQLLEFQRLGLEQGVKPTEQEQQALAESQQLFLANQQQYQELNEEVAAQEEQLRELQEQQRQNALALQEARVPLAAEYERLYERHELRQAGLKLGVLAPLLVASIVLFVKMREGVYALQSAAFALAVGAKVMRVMHEYFPSRYFKYVLILTFLAIVMKVLHALIRAMTNPKRDALLKQYREAYEAFLCPACEYPIRRGPLKFLFWTRRSLKKLRIPTAEAQADGPYNCPACGTKLFDRCAACERIRHTLLPTCEHCGAETDPLAPSPAKS